MKVHLLSSFILSLLFSTATLCAQSILLVKPIGFELGKTNQLLIRGTGLTNEGLTISATNGSLVISTNRKAEVNTQMDAKKVGDTEIVAELFPASPEVAFYLSNTNIPFKLIPLQGEVTKEKEPNNGFKKPQVVSRKVCIQGEIGSPNDVDVFQVDLAANEKLTVALTAAAAGSSLDSIITIYNENGYMAATNDDQSDKNRDSMLEFTPAKAGTYFISVIDAHEKGSSTHIYLLHLN